jgi:hypothetical protein
VKSSNSIDYVDVLLQLHVTCLYRQQDVALWVGYDQIFHKQTKSLKRTRTLSNLKKLDILVWQTG